MTTTEAVTTMTTCAANCWYAREETCRCSCGGVAHGCLRNGQDWEDVQPIRTMMVKGTRYHLHSVHTGYGAAWRYVREAFGMAAVSGSKQCIVKPAHAGAFKWPELSGRQPSRFFQEHPYIVWERE